MKVRDLIKELIELDQDVDIKINLMGGSMPDYLNYFAEADYIDIMKTQMFMKFV
jgi:hypothetical protein